MSKKLRIKNNVSVASNDEELYAQAQARANKYKKFGETDIVYVPTAILKDPITGRNIAIDIEC